MKYTKFQKIISSIVLFGFFFTFIFRFPSFNFFDNASADNKDFYSLVSVIVEEGIYSDIKSEVNRYATDIQNTLENTKVVILPTPKNASAFDIASLNEGLYFDGYNSINKSDFKSRLIGTVLIGKLPIPIVYDQNKNSKTILPYVDFEDKSYFYNHKTNKYELGNSNLNGFKPEIWHGVISPNSGDEKEDIKEIKDYFEKNHNFYLGTGNFQTSNGIINGNKIEENNLDYQPYVFYFDQIRTNQSLLYNLYKSYESYLENKEDLIYNRFSKELAENLKNKFLAKDSESLETLIKNVDPDFDTSSFSGNLSTKNITDIQSRYIIEKSTKKFLEIFNGPSLGKVTENVHNAGRYKGSGSKVNVDMIPALISVLDGVSDEIIKSVNNDLESYIDELVMTGGLSRKIAISTNIFFNDNCSSTYTNFLYGKQAINIKNASECSIYLGSNTNSGKVVEANRGLNIKLIQNDASSCNDKLISNNGIISGGISGYWGGNTPLNIDSSNFENLKLRNHDLKSSIISLFDVNGSKEVKDNSKVLSPLNCLENNLLLTNKGDYNKDNNCETSYNVPINSTSAINWDCTTNNTKYGYSNTFNFESIFNNLPGNTCLNLNGNLIKKNGDCDNQYNFKTINSYITHKSPTSDELTKQVNTLITPNLGIDKNRYIDFIGANGKYSKIYYPYLFRIFANKSKELTIDSISQDIKSFLDLKTLEINNLIKSINPNSLSGNNKEIFDLLKISNFSKKNVDLYNYIKSKPLTEYSFLGDKKSLSYYDTLAFSIYWNNLPNVGAKYKFVIENYLSDEFGGNNFNFHLPKNKKSYEIAYLGAEGDGENMYIKVDPEDKGENPYSDILLKNKELSTFLYSAKIDDSNYGKEKSDECSPPSGVPIWEWMSSITCWTKDILPPTAQISSTNLLSEVEKKELILCSKDLNKNGINDCFETKFKLGNLELKSDSLIYSYNTSGNLIASIKQNNGKIAKFDNNTKINFELSRIDIPDNKNKDIIVGNIKTVFNKEKRYEGDEAEIQKYVNFSPSSITVKAGEINTSFSVKNKDSNVYFNAYLEIKDNKGNSKIKLNSKDLLIKIRFGTLFLESTKLSKEEGKLKIESSNNSTIASNEKNIYLVDSFKNKTKEISNLVDKDSSSKEKLILSISNVSNKNELFPLSYPLNISLLNNNGEKVSNDIIVKSNELNNFKNLFSLSKSGIYKVEITDSLGYNVTKKINIIPEQPSKIDVKLGSSILQTGGNITTNIVYILDKFGNLVSGNLYNMDLSINGGGITFNDTEKDKISLDIFEGYKAFRLKSTDNEGINDLNIKLKDFSGKTILEQKSNVKTINNIVLNLSSNQPNIKIGKGIYDFDLTITDKLGNLLNGFNSRLYLSINKIYGIPTSSYVEIKDGRAKVSFETTLVAGQNIPLEFQVEGLIGITKKNINILPDFPMSLDLNLSKSKMEASLNESSILSVELKDRYGNLVFNDNSTNLSLEIDPKYSNIISSKTKVEKTNGGIASFKIFGKQNPGTAYFKVSANGNFSNNEIEIIGGNNKLSIKGVGENVGKIETFYFWNKEKVIGKKYNSIYTSLLGASYGDITKKDYLASALLFDKNNRSLAVTSLLNEPFSYDDIVNINPNGAIGSIYQSSNLNQDINYNIDISNNKLNIDLFNNSTNTYIGKVFYNIDPKTELKSCIGNIDDFSDCNVSNLKSSILLKSLNKNYSSYKINQNLVFKDNSGKDILKISPNGEITKLGNIYFELNKNNKNKYLTLNIKYLNSNIGILGVSLINSKILISKNEALFNNYINTQENSILVYLKSNSYLFRDIYSDDKNYNKVLYYKNNSSSKKSNQDYFSKDNSYAIENFDSQDGIGWTIGNKYLLSFSAGESVGDATKDYQSFSLINLGDPIISLKKIKNKFQNTNNYKSFDATIGEHITNDKDIFGYRTFDYNNDGKKDILLIKNDGNLRLIENKQTNNGFIDRGNLAIISDLGEKNLVLTGDFDGDGFGDIFFVNDKQKPGILKNYGKEFKRINSSNQINVEGKIIQAREFDMDNDNIDDIIILDDNGGIYIFYGTKSGLFTKVQIDSSYKISLDNTSRNDNSLIYFDGLYQFPSSISKGDIIKENESLFSSFPANFSKSGSTKKIASDNKNLMKLYSGSIDNNKNISPFFNESILKNSIFEEVLYNTGSDENNSNNIFSRIPDYTEVSPQTIEVSESVNKARLDFENLIKDYPEYVTGSIEQNYTKNTNFIKTEYSKLLGLEVNKSFKNISPNLKSGNNVLVEIILKNTSGNTLKNIAYLEKVPDIFDLNPNSINISTDSKVQINKVSGYNFLINNFSIPNNGTVKITYNSKVLPIKYGFLQIGLFENGELGDDEFGDVVIKANKKDSSKQLLIYRSTEYRKYEKGTKILEEDQNKIKLPESIAKNAIDNDKNGTPDYIDKIKSSKSNYQNYSKDSLKQINKDKDRDGIPDLEDYSSKFNSEDSSLIGIFDSLNQSVDEISEGIDNVISSLCNGFGECFSLPVNWAPLAPGGDPSIFGFPVGDGLKVEEGLPIFSALTRIWYGPVCAPTVWPPSPLGAGCSIPSAGGRLGTWDPTNFFRLFVTPTITGAIGIAACFGGASEFGREPFPGVSPIIPGGNCVVTAMPLPLCSDDGSDGDIESTGLPQVSSKKLNKNKYDVIISNSKNNIKHTNGLIDEKVVGEYLKSKHNKNYKPKYPVDINSKNFIFSGQNKSLVNMNSGGEGDMEIGVDVDVQSLITGNFGDVIKIKQNRVWGFPDFLMSWVNRQIEEIVNKLTDFPTIFIIIPDFSGILNGLSGEVDDLFGNIDQIKNNISEGEKTRDNKIQSQIDNIKSSKCSGIDCYLNNAKVGKLNVEKSISPKLISSIQNVYELLGNIPLVSIRTQVININIPWIDPDNIRNTLFNRELTAKQWEDEIDRATDSWSLGATCETKECRDENEAGNKVLVNARGLVSSIKRNIETLKTYKDFPEQLNKMLNIKEVRLGQIVSNLETISKITGGRLGKNGKKFKSWVELYIIAKTILESWQLLVDIFLDYQEECAACKNERYTLLYFILKLISIIIPEIPVIQFPKWPDIVIDLSNIRVGIDIYLPEFSFTKRPIILPNLPNLHLPDVPNFGLSLPGIPTLPSLQIPKLPDLPTLPPINLPDLPTPPKLPNILGAFKAILKILKLIVKIMCILRSSPFVPEWRAGDQIAFITSRTGFLFLDFIDLSLPKISLPFVDKIGFQSFLNFEFGTDFITQMVENTVSPLSTFTNDVSSMTNVNIGDINLQNNVPSNVDLNIDKKGNLDPRVGLNNNQILKVLVLGLSKKFVDMVSYIDENKNIKVDNKDFISMVNLSLSSKEIVGNPKADKLRNLWKEVANLTYSLEDKKINELKKNNEDKFNTLKDILNTEIELNRAKRKTLEKGIFLNNGIFKNVSSIDEIKTKVQVYNERLRPYNYNLVKSIKNLKTGGNKEKEELQTQGEKVLTRINSGLYRFNNTLESNENNDNKLLSLNTSNNSGSSSTVTKQQTNTEYGYHYEGIYVIEDDKSYRLFDYTSELDGTEETSIIDYDLDNDADLLYMVNNELFLKKNLSINGDGNKKYVTESPIVVSPKDNKFFNLNNKYIEAVNYFKEGHISNGNINLNFDGSSDIKINNYRVETYKIIDDIDNDGQKGVKKSIIDGFSSIKDITISEKNKDYILRNNLGYINDIGSTSGLKLTTKSLINIKKDISNNVIVNLLAGNILYAGGENFKIKYYPVGDETNIKSLTISKYQNIEFSDDIKIIGMDGDAYIEGDSNVVLNDVLIRTYYKKPLFPGTKIELLSNDSEFNEKSHISIEYYDNSQLGIDFRNFIDYKLYDLLDNTDNYSINTEKQNGYNYAKITPFRNNIYGTTTNIELVSPQIEADRNVPELLMTSPIKIPIYKKKLIDLSPYIYEDSGLGNIEEVYTDLDLNVDSNDDGNTKNDKDINLSKLIKNPDSIKIEFGPFNKPENKKIGITLIDKSGNIGFREVSFEVYSPIPEIKEFKDNKVIGKIGEKLDNEPINLYRNRGGILERINKNEVFTSSGNYTFDNIETSSGLILSRSGSIIANIDEYTGKIELKGNSSNSKIKVDILGSYPELILNYKGENIYSQFISFVLNLPINIVEDFNSINFEKEGLYIKIYNNSLYDSYIIPKGVNYNPGAFVTYKKGNNTPIISIFQDGRVNLSSLYYFDYETFGNYIILNLKEIVSKKSIAKILYNIKGSYIIK